MRLILQTISCCAAVFIILCSPPLFADASDLDLLEQKLAEVENLKNRLSDRKASLQGLEKRLDAKLREIEWELESRAAGLDNPDYAQAVKHPGVVHDLFILQRIYAYQRSLAEIIAQFEQSLEMLEHFEQRIIDTKKLLEQVSAMNIDNLVNMMETAIKGREPLLRTHLIPMPEMDEKQNKTIWDNIR